jgi:uroporphyrinogen decarboxylase
MESLDRYVRAMKRQPVDRVPIGSMISLPYWSRSLGGVTGLSGHMVAHPLLWIERQEELGLDPILFPYWFREPYITDWPRAFFRWPSDVCRDWQVSSQITERNDVDTVLRKRIRTPAGEMTALIKREPFQKWVIEHPLKKESDLGHLLYRPDPAQVNASGLQQVLRSANGRALVMLVVAGVFDEACHWRGMESLVMDIYDRPQWVHRLMKVLVEYTLRVVRRLGQIALHSIMIDESSVGLGISPKMFREFVLPYDQQIAAACRETGILTSFHICGRSAALLELMADVGADAIEPLVPVECAGDVELADAKRRVGSRVSLMGGFNERLLSGGTVEDVRAAALKCIEAAAAGGGYIMRTAGQIFEAKAENLNAFAEAARNCRQYP